MAKVIGFDKQHFLQVTCRECAAVIEYVRNEVYRPGMTDEGTKIEGLKCPNCGDFVRTNP